MGKLKKVNKGSFKKRNLDGTEYIPETAYIFEAGGLQWIVFRDENNYWTVNGVNGYVKLVAFCKTRKEAVEKAEKIRKLTKEEIKSAYESTLQRAIKKTNQNKKNMNYIAKEI
jgi:hypothetical protein